MPIKSLNSFFNHWVTWALISALVLGAGLLNAWLGFPFPAPAEGIYSTIGGVIPYSDAEAYLAGAHRFLENGFLDPWNMRRPLSTLLLAFYLKITNFNFWYVMLIQMSVCVVALSLYLKVVRQDLGILATFISLIFIAYYAQTYMHTTLSEILGLTFGLFSFVLLWNGWIQKNRLIYNAGMAVLAVALSARAGPNFMVCGFIFLIYLEPFTKSRLKDLSYSLFSFGIPFFLISKLSTFFGSPSGEGMAFSNFGLTLYGLVNGGKGWLYAYSDPLIQDIVNGKGEAQQSIILYQESWRAFKNNPFSIIIGMGKYLGGFFIWFIRRLTFGEGPVKILTTMASVVFFIFMSVRIYIKRHFLNQGFLFLIVTFISVAVSSMIIFKDGGMRTFAVAIPFMGALFGYAFSAGPSLVTRKGYENIIASCGALLIILASMLALNIPSRTQKPDMTTLNVSQISGQETLLTYNPNNQPHLLIESSPGFHFRTISSETIRASWFIYSTSDESVGKELAKIVNGYKNNNLVLLHIYDYISHSSKWVLAENHILNIDSEWIEIQANLIAKDFSKIYKANSYMEPSQK